MRGFLVSVIAGVMSFGLVSAAARAADAVPEAPGPPAAPRQAVVLDTYGFWRMHHTLAPPLIEAGGRLTPIVYGYQWMDAGTSDPPSDWPEVGFDDSSWLRGPARMSCLTPYLSRLCMRGYFAVTDPAQVGDLTLTLVYHGGAIVYLNGKEIARGHVAAAQPGRPTMAEAYPPDAFVGENGKLLRGWEKNESDQDAEIRGRLALRTRTLRDVHLPGNLLRKGRNVLAVELVRAPYPPNVDLGKPRTGMATARTDRAACELDFNTCELTGLQVRASTAAGLECNSFRATGLRVWNGDILAADYDLDFGGQAGEPLHPVRITAVRNGTFGGKFVVGSGEPIRKLRVAVSDLSSGKAAIPAAAVQIRYGQPWGTEAGAYGAGTCGYDKSLNGTRLYRYQRPPVLLGALMDAPPEEIPVAVRATDRTLALDSRIPKPPEMVHGAVVPVWLSVRVPKDAAAGEYTGRVTVQAEGASPLEVPIEVRVVDWALPDPEDFGTWIDMIQSPDTLALEYDVPLWSEQHWKLIDRSMDLLRGVGNRVLYVPLIAQSNLGNAESMVRWIDKGDGTYDWDFSIMDKYLDHCVAHMGRPSIIVLYAWEIYIAETKQLKPGFDDPKIARTREALKGTPLVTVVDPGGGKTETRSLPPLSDPASKGLWKGLFAAMRHHVEARGLADRLMLGTMSDAWPSKEEVTFYADAAGDLKWFSDSHPGIADIKRNMEALKTARPGSSLREASYPTVKNPDDEISVLSRVGYSARVWFSTFGEQSKTGDSLLGWRSPELYVQHDRHADAHPMSRWHLMPEQNIIGEQHGVGRLGGDWWRCVKNAGGRRAAMARDRYPQSLWRNLDMNIQTMAPGPEGAVATHRFENLREGLQECEARIFVERALADPRLKEKLGPELTRKAQELLRRRAVLVTKASSGLQMGGLDWNHVFNMRGFFMWPNMAGHCWFVGCGWQRMNEELFATAAAVAGRLGGG